MLNLSLNLQEILKKLTLINNLEFVRADNK